MSRTRAAILAGLVTVILAVALPGVPFVVAQDGVLDCSPPDKALLADLRDVAEEYGWTLEEAIAKDCRNQVVERVARDIREAEGERLVAVDLGKDLDEVPRLFLKGRASDLVQRLVQESGIRIDIVEDEPYTEAQIHQRQHRVQQALLGLGLEQFSVGTDVIGDGHIDVRVRLTPATPSREAILAAIPEDLRADVALTITAEGDWDGDVGTVADPCASPGIPSPSASPGASAPPVPSPSSIGSPSAGATLATPGPSASLVTASPSSSPGPASPAPSGDPCASPEPGASPAALFSPSERWGPIAIAEARDEDMADVGAEVDARLVIGERCVTLRKGGSKTTLVFRDGQVTWDAKRERIRFRDTDGQRHVLKDGDRIVGIVGGYDPWTDTGPGPGIPAWVVQPNPACPDELFLITSFPKAR